jgi:hypothetical protein
MDRVHGSRFTGSMRLIKPEPSNSISAAQILLDQKGILRSNIDRQFMDIQ